MPKSGECKPIKKRLLESRAIDKKTKCWVWVKTLNSTGYGTITIGSRTDGSRRTWLVHRAAYEVFLGKIPYGLFVCHKCDNPKCFNPEHLFLGTALDNTRDSITKGRYDFKHGWTGEDHPMAKLVADDVRAIRRSAEDAHALAEKYGLNHNHIRGIRAGRHWKSVPFELDAPKRQRRLGRDPMKRRTYK